MSPVIEDTTLSSAEPSPQRAADLRLHMNETCRNDLINYAGAARKVFPRLSATAVEAASAIDPSAKLNPELFSVHWRLSSGLRERQPADVASMLGRLARLHEDGDLCRDNFAVENFSWDLVDVGIVDYLTSSEGPQATDGRPPELARMAVDEFDTYRGLAQEAIAVIAELDQDLYGEFEHVVSGLRLFNGHGVRGMSSPRCWGKILLRTPAPGPEADEPILYYVDHITHETSHLVLFAIMGVDPLINNGFTERYAAPIRPEPRPLYGIYHAMFVLSRIVRVLARYSDLVSRPAVTEVLDATLQRFEHGYKTIRDHADLTPAGERMATSCRALVEAAV